MTNDTPDPTTMIAGILRTLDLQFDTASDVWIDALPGSSYSVHATPETYYRDPVLAVPPANENGESISDRAIGQSNNEALDSFGIPIDSHGTVDLDFRFSSEKEADTAAAALLDAIRSLEDYPILDDERHSALELEFAEEDWEFSLGGRSDAEDAIRDALCERLGIEDTGSVEIDLSRCEEADSIAMQAWHERSGYEHGPVQPEDDGWMPSLEALARSGALEVYTYPSTFTDPWPIVSDPSAEAGEARRVYRTTGDATALLALLPDYVPGRLPDDDADLALLLGALVDLVPVDLGPALQLPPAD